MIKLLLLLDLVPFPCSGFVLAGGETESLAVKAFSQSGSCWLHPSGSLSRFLFLLFCVDLKARSGTVGFSQVGGFHYSESLCFRGQLNQDVVLAQLLAQVLLQILIHSLVLRGSFHNNGGTDASSDRCCWFSEE